MTQVAREVDRRLLIAGEVARCVLFSPLAVVCGVGAGGCQERIIGANRGPVVYGPVGIRAAAMWRIKVASGQAAAKARRTREAISTTRAPSFSSRRRMVLNSGSPG